jgi:predicted MFS family arabinose efflux permease
MFSAMVPIAQAIAPTIGEFTLRSMGPHVMMVEGAAWVLCGLILTVPLRPLPKPTASGRLDFRSSLQRRYILPVAGLLAGGTIFGYAFAYIGPALAERGISLSWFFIASTFAMIFGRVGIGRYVSVLPPPFIAGLGLLFSCLSLVVAAFAVHPLVAAVAGAALGIGNSVMYPVLSSWMSYGLGPTQRAGVQSLAATAFYFGIYAAPFPQSWVIGAIGYVRTQLWLAAACAIVGVVMVFLGRRAQD